MSGTYEAAKAEVLARSGDPHMEQCEHCKPYVDDLIRNEIYQMESARKEYNAAVANGLIGRARVIARRIDR